MYINKIDELIDDLLDKFNKKLSKSELLERLKKEPNFVKYQSKINDFIKDFINGIDKVPITNLVPSPNNVASILNIMTRYVAYYIYLTIAYYYADSRELYVTNIVECSKNQKNSTFQINDFFNSENNAMLVKFYTVIKNILTLVKLGSINKIQMIVQNNPVLYQSTIMLFNSLGETYIQDHFMISNNLNNIIKTIIFRELYLRQEKAEVYTILNKKEKENAEYRFINIVVAKKGDSMDYNAIEKLFSIEERRSGMVDDIYNFLIEMDKAKTELFMSNEEKVKILFDKEIIIPITEDFLRYHKGTESYDAFEPLNKKSLREKDDTKLKYIVNKMNSVRNYYSTAVQRNNKLKIETQKLFYKPLDFRNVVTYNDFEEVRILKKLENIGKKSSETDYLIDLLGFREYAFQNFKDFNNDGFRVKVDTTIPIIRYVNIEHMNPKRVLQYRVGSENMPLMVVGVAFRNSPVPLQCGMSYQLKDVRGILKTGNGFSAFSKLLADRFYKESQDFYYWIFNNKEDKPLNKSYKNISSLNIQQNLTIMLAGIYDQALELIQNKIIEKISNMKSENLSIWYFHQLLNKYSEKYLCLYRHPGIRNKIFKYLIQNKLPRVTDFYDETEDIIPGVSDKDFIKLPVYNPEKDTRNIIKIGRDFEEIKSENTFKNQTMSICQHNISWQAIMKISKRKTKEFNQEIFNFTKKYVRENDDGEYICKSCSELLSIKKFVYEGSYDKTTGSFITTNMALDTNLSDLPEYEKYSKTIKNLDKIIEKISYTSNLLYYVGSVYTVKIRRNTLVKEVIDLLLQHNKILKKNTEERSKEAKKYGIDKSFTNLFVFSLTDEIFITSSKDTDYYKVIKYNNILAYVLFAIITDINPGQISNLSYEKKCNYFLFKQYGIKLFDGLMIKINNADDVKPIQDYPTLCYLLYYFSCTLIQFKIWLFQDMEKSGFHPHIQKSIIHTMVDLINSILVINQQTDKNFLYEILATRFFVKLDNIYSDTDVLHLLEEQSNSNIKIDKQKNKISFIKKNIPGIQIGINTKYIQEEDHIESCESVTTEINQQYLRLIDNEVDVLTNCNDGEFHDWVYKKGELKCMKCNKTYEELQKIVNKKNDNNQKEVLFKIKLINLAKLAKKYCVSGQLHDIDPQTGICSKCKVKVADTLFSEKQLLELEKNLERNKEEIIMQEIKNQENEYTKKIKDEKKLNKFKNKTIKQFQKKGSNIKQVIDNLTQKIEKIVGSHITIENNRDIYINKTIFKIDHDYLGDKLKKPITISDTDNKIKYKSNDNFFKADVIYYFDKSNNVDVYYNAITNHLLGYKETNKEYKLNNKTDNYLITNLSLKDQLYLLGYENKYINVYSIDSKFENDPELINKNKGHIVDSIVRSRIRNLKNIIILFQKILTRVKTNIKNRKSESINPVFNEIIDNYSKKIKDINLTNKDNKKAVFKNWKKIQEDFYFDPQKTKTQLDDISFNGNYVSSYQITKLENTDIMILFFILMQLEKLLKYNDTKFDQINISSLIVSIINYAFLNYYDDTYSLDINKFKILLDSDSSIVDENLHEVGIYSELITTDELEDPEIRENMEENIEINTSMDLDEDAEYDDDDYIQEYDGVTYDF
ncbi:hypothetical protein CPAV1605_1273 [seawater metagenome]|uniref:Uncharacterized protein n=1 Tax=seawater metagenome TaxID=1561972 RepID=A0A5E8CM88_9ZZZZ